MTFLVRAISRLMLVLLLAWPGAAQAYDYTFCFEMDHTFNDNGYGEDYWTTDTYRALRGMHVNVSWHESCDGTGPFLTIFSGEKTDSSGCLPEFSTALNDCFKITINSWGTTGDNNTIFSKDGSGLTATIVTPSYDPPNSSGTYTLQYSDQEQFRLYGTLAYLINNSYAGSMSDEVLTSYSTDGSICPCGPGSCAGGINTMCFAEPQDSSKFVIAHEYGHVNQGATQTGSIANDCTWNMQGGHGMTTKEFMSCAMTEGWANFVSADGWNDDSAGAGGKLRYWGDCRGSSTIDIESSGDAADCVVKYLENNFTGYGGRGTELDWMRTYWDYHTNDQTSHPGSAASHTQMQAEMDASDLSSNENMYDDYRQGIAAESGCDQYERIVFMAAANGADHCKSGCDDVSGCTDCDATGCGYDE